MNAQASALRFFFTITLGGADLAHQRPEPTTRGSCRGSLRRSRSPS
jgi:hypothetical protein